MVDQSLSPTRKSDAPDPPDPPDPLDPLDPLDELDALIKRDRLAAAAIAKTLFSQAITSAISNVSQINQIANARIQADSQVAGARLSSGAEVHAVSLMANARLAIEEIETRHLRNPREADLVSAMVTEVGRTAETQIAESATAAIVAIKQQAEAAIANLSSGAKESIAQIRDIATDVGADVRAQADVAAVKFTADMAGERTPESVAEEAAEAARKILLHAHKVTSNLHEKVSAAIAEINEVTSRSIKNLGVLVDKAEARILSVRDFALTHLQDILKAKPKK